MHFISEIQQARTDMVSSRRTILVRAVGGRGRGEGRGGQNLAKARRRREGREGRGKGGQATAGNLPLNFSKASLFFGYGSEQLTPSINFDFTRGQFVEIFDFIGENEVFRGL